MGATRSRSLCITPDISAPSLCHLETRPPGHTDRCIHNELADNPRVCLPTICLIGRCLQQVMSQKIEQVILISPVWPTQHWYPLVLQLCMDLPILLPLSADLLIKDNQPHFLNKLQLASWKLSANVSKQQAFQQKLESFCWKHGDEAPPALTPQLGVSGLVGVVNSRSIPFQYL